MGYTIVVGEHRLLVVPGTTPPVPIATASVTDPAGNPPPFAVGSAATIKDDGAGNLECVGNFPTLEGTPLNFDLKSGGTVASHGVTVTAASFDWTLGEPV